jgi:hypothetical protein
VAQGARSVCRCVAVPRIYRDHEAIRDLGTKCPQIPGEWCEPAARKGRSPRVRAVWVVPSQKKKALLKKNPAGSWLPSHSGAGRFSLFRFLWLLLSWKEGEETFAPGHSAPWPNKPDLT